MPDIDLEPAKNYRAAPVKGEKAFAPGGLKRLGVYAAVVATMIVAGSILRPIVDWIWSLWGG